MSYLEIEKMREQAKKRFGEHAAIEAEQMQSVDLGMKKTELNFQRIAIDYEELYKRYNTVVQVLQSQQKNAVTIIRSPGLEQCAKFLNYMKTQQDKHMKFISDHTNPVRRPDYTTVPMKRILVSFIQDCIDRFFSEDWFALYKAPIETYLRDKAIRKKKTKQNQTKKQKIETQ